MMIIFAVLALGSLSWETPWSSGQNSDVTPWSGQNSEIRKENREGFFRALESKSSVIPEGGDDDSEGARAIAQLPWSDYESGDQKIWSSGQALLWPVPYGKLSSPYGVRGSGFHEGVDIRASTGSRVRAAAPGIVVFSNWIKGYGRTIVIHHGEGLTTIYAHNAENIKVAGDIVEQGDTLALVGKSGHATGPHLHFEVRKRGRTVNPLDYSFSRTPLVAAIESSR